MDVPQLKLLAGRVRGLLEQRNTVIGHSQSLDLVAALPGLRNWPEVNAFPKHVAACELDAVTVGRLARRLRVQHDVELATEELLGLLDLAPDGTHTPAAEAVTQLWPSGPRPGVYLTTSGAAIDALLDEYDDATDGALLYAEEAGARDSNAINLGENGLWSTGLARVPSGTLLVLGPLEFTQEEWDNNAQRLQQACALALEHGLRVAVLVNTPAPRQLRSDALLLVRSVDDGEVDDELPRALRGIVTETGQLQELAPFATAPKLEPQPRFSTQARLPADVEQAVRSAAARNPFGVIVLGSNERKPERAVLLEALLPLTEAAGPVARILPDHRHDYDGQPPLSAQFAELPVMPSVESAYAHGYRRMVVEKYFGSHGDPMRFADDVCFLTSAFSAECDAAFLHTVSNLRGEDTRPLQRLLAAIGLAVFDTRAGKTFVADLYVRPGGPLPTTDDLDAVGSHLRDNRLLRWQDGLEKLLASKTVSAAQVRKACPNHFAIHDFLAARTARAKKPAVAEG